MAASNTRQSYWMKKSYRVPSPSSWLFRIQYTFTISTSGRNGYLTRILRTSLARSGLDTTMIQRKAILNRNRSPYCCWNIRRMSFRPLGLVLPEEMIFRLWCREKKPHCIVYQTFFVFWKTDDLVSRDTRQKC